MGEVYRARDPRLGRDVAIKVLPSDMASEPARLQRFEREARAASALSHPNIITVFDVGREGSVAYMAIELVDGKTLHEILAPGRLPIRKLLDFAVQMADGLASAHEAGIVHRDLKPRNVMISRSGFVKILDFGLAKLEVSATGSRARAPSDTVTDPETLPGAVLGTTDYMSPEQARGGAIDARSDQFSLGAVLYEMVTGRRAFARETRADTLLAILQQEPAPIAPLRSDTPAPLRWIIERCLAKSPADRYVSTRDLSRDLQTLRDHIGETSTGQAAAAPSHSTGLLGRRLGAAAVLAVLTGTAVLLLFGGHRSSRPEFRRLTFRSGLISRALFVPNSNSILYSASWEGQQPGSFLTLPDSPGFDLRLESEPQIPMAYSGDGSQVLALLGVSRTAIDLRGMLAWLPLHGGKPRPLLDGVGWADWAPKGRFFAVVRDTGNERVLETRSENGETKTLFRTQGAISRVRLSPDERAVAFIHHPSRFDDAGQIYLAFTDGSGSKALSPQYERCLGLDWNRKSGEIWFTASPGSPYSSTIWAVRTSGRPRALYSLPDLFVLQNVSPDGSACLLILNESRISLIVRRPTEPLRDLSWLGLTMVADLSPDASAVLFSDSLPTRGAPTIWTRSLDGSDAVLLGPGEPGAFSPDGHSIAALTSPLTGPAQLQIVSNGAGSPLAVAPSNKSRWSPSFAGPSTILFVSSDGIRNQIWRIRSDGSGLQALGAIGCDQPRADPSLTEFLCICGPEKKDLFVYPLNPGVGRRLYRLAGKDRFASIRWSGSGDRIFAATSERQFLTMNASTGSVLFQETLPVPAGGIYGAFYGAAFSDDGTVQAYSIARSSSGLYYCAGLE